MMKPKFLFSLTALFLVIAAHGFSQEKNKKLDRKFLGDELQFGRDAAKFGLWNEAIFRWEKVVLQEPDNALAINNLAIAYEYVGNYEKARELYKTALDLDEDSQDIKRNYKRFLSFYKRHQRQLAREKKSEDIVVDDDDSDTVDDLNDGKDLL